MASLSSGDTVYKVVAARWQDDDVQLVSALMELTGDHMLIYPVGREVTPFHDAYLYAFRDREQAIAYADSPKGILTNYVALQVWKATARIIGTKPLQGVDVEPFWADQQHSLEYPCPNVWTCPPGSVWCSSITLDALIYGGSPRKPAIKKGKK